MDKQILAFGINKYPFPEQLSKKIIKKLNKNKHWEDSLVGGPNFTDKRISIRSSTTISLKELDYDLWADTKSVLAQAVKDYSKEFNISITRDESLDVLRYEDYDKYDYHVDAAVDLYRVLSGLIYLNPTEYSGGETHFKFLDLGVKPDSPSIVLFPSNYMYLHSAMPITSGKKYVAVTWFNDIPI